MCVNGSRQIEHLIALLAGVLVLAGCGSKPAQLLQHTGWKNSSTTADDGTKFEVACRDGEWDVGLKTLERLVPAEADSQWVARDIFIQFDGQPAQLTKGTLNENRLDLEQTLEDSTVALNYGQDVAAGVLRGKFKTLTIRTTDGAKRPKVWRFDLTGAGNNIPRTDPFGQSCPAPASSGAV